MALPLDFSLRLEDRGGQRVLVSALLAPTEGVVRLDGVALQVFNRQGDALGVRLLLPIAGELHQAMLSTVELKCREIPQGSRVVGTAWWGLEQREAVLPTDPFTELEQHVRARKRLGTFADATDLDVVEGEERLRLARIYPWVQEPRVPVTTPALEVVEPEEDVDDLVDHLGLDEDSTEWLKDLLSEE